ncbi:hypothetical protein WA026_022897 [Henosepilachna vigintioctopunctata]|uniref:Uncharacterized protein n=1 Tax=Henosepilachna vigintioctopunctata TaxID=420089 RepID=A0AAW1TZ46_9CUCU
MENYIKFKQVGGKLQLKKGIVSHKFKCQNVRKYKSERSAVKKRNLIKYFEKILSTDEENPSTSCLPKNPRDPLGFGNNNQSLETSRKHKAVQLKLKNKVIHKSTITEEKYSKRDEKTTSLKKADTVSIYSFSGAFSDMSTDKMYNPDQNSDTSDIYKSE